MKNQKPIPNPNIQIIKDNFYWVRKTENHLFEPARCNIPALTKVQFFFFTNGSVMEVERAWDYKPLQYSEI